MVYRFAISAWPKQKLHVRFGFLEKVVFPEREIIKSKETYRELKDSPISNFEKLDHIEVRTAYEKRTTEPYPDFLSISVTLFAINSKAKAFLDENGISYKTKPIIILNDSSVEYELVMFSTLDLVEPSQLYKNERGVWCLKDDEIVLQKQSTMVRGIYRLDKLHNSLICDEGTKHALEVSGLIGFRFKPHKVAPCTH